jgi:hypothetical protein
LQGRLAFSALFLHLSKLVWKVIALPIEAIRYSPRALLAAASHI